MCTRNRVTKSNPSLNSAHLYCPYVSVTPIHVSGNVKKKTLKMSVDFSSESHEREEPWRKESRDTSSVCPLIQGFLTCVQLRKENKKLVVVVCVLFCVCWVCICLQFIFSCYIVLFTFGQKQCLSTEENSREANIATANETWQRICNFM